ncbi:MAG: hypothetical protein NTX72_02870 [Candidatus Uhrbacteria bacterium]|nr:hypothetical protein [Candidatus Uhrbacteria bacterium]
MRRFVLRKLALFDWIDQLKEQDRTIAYRIYTLVDYIRLSKKLPFAAALPFLAIPLLLSPALNQIQPNAILPLILSQIVFASVCYGSSALVLYLLVFGPIRSKWIRELQQLFFSPDAARVLDLLIPLDQDLASQTHIFLRLPHLRPSRRARHHSV